MGLDEQFFTYIRDGNHEEMAITILRPHRSQIKNQKSKYVPNHETSQQTERDSTMVNREATTRDGESERVRQRYSRNLDVRYMSSWKSLKERLMSAYSCNQQQCPMIKERLLQHHQSVHGGRVCEKKCTLATSKSKNCVSIRAGPDFDQYSDQKCEDCPMPHTSSNYNKKNSNSRTCFIKPSKSNLKTSKKYVEGCTSPCDIPAKKEQIKNEHAKRRFDECVNTSCNSTLITKSNGNDCCDLEINNKIQNVNNGYDKNNNIVRCSDTEIRSENITGENENTSNCCTDLNKLNKKINNLYDTNEKFENTSNSITHNNKQIRINKNDDINNCCNIDCNKHKRKINTRCNANSNVESASDATTCDKNMINEKNFNDSCDVNLIKYKRNVNKTCDANNNYKNSNHSNDCCKLVVPNVSENSNNMNNVKYINGCTMPSDLLIDGVNSYCEGSADLGNPNNCIEYTENCRIVSSNNNNNNDSYECSNSYVEGCTTPSDDNLISERNCDSLKISSCTDNFTTTYNSSYIGNVKAPEFPLLSSPKNKNEDNCRPSTLKHRNDYPFISKTDKPTNTPTMIDAGNNCEIDKNKLFSNNLYTVDESTGGDSVMSSLMNIVKNRRNRKNKSTKTSKNALVKKSSDSNKSYVYEPTVPYTVDKLSDRKSNSKLSLSNYERKQERNSDTNRIYNEVKEWIYEMPIYPGSEKEAKEKNSSIVNNLANSINKLFVETGSPRYDEKIRKLIEVCLDEIPFWYPGAKKEQNEYKHSLVDRLIKRLKNLNRKNVGTNSKRKHNKHSVTEVHTSLTTCNRKFRTHFTNEPKDVEVKICVIEWLRSIYSKTDYNNVLKDQIFLLADYITFRIKPLMSKFINTKYLKIILKTLILNIIKDLPVIVTDSPISKEMYIQDIAEELVTSLLCIQAKYGCTFSYFATSSKFYESQRKSVICNEIRKCFEDTGVDCNNGVIEEAGNLIENCYELSNFKGKRYTRNEIMNLLVTSTNLSEIQAWNLAKMIIKKVRDIFNEGEECASSQTCNQLRKPYTTSVYTSIERANQAYPVTSTPKKKRPKKEVPKLSPQEEQYLENVKNLIRDWMNILPETFTDQEFKETMISDLANSILDDAKLDQLAPDPKKDSRLILKYIVIRWLYKSEAYEDYYIDDEVEVFIDKLQELPVPTLIQPYYGNRQTIKNIKFNEAKGRADNTSNLPDNFVPKGRDVLEDEISIWMHEQPSDVFVNNDHKFKQEKTHELAEILENKAGKKLTQNQVIRDISKWLNQIVKPEKNREVSELVDELKYRLIHLPHDATLAGIVEDRARDREAYRRSKLESVNPKKTYLSNSKTDDESADLENTMAIFISKFIERHYDIDDPLARHAFNRLLLSHLVSLNPSIKNEVYDKFKNSEFNYKFPPQRAIIELEYIKDISDWLKNIPVDPLYNTLGNKERIDFVNSLALSIREIEENRKNKPGEMDYDIYLLYEILDHLKLLPLPKEHCMHFPFIANQLYNKICMHRHIVADVIKANESINSTGINPDNVGDFIEEFIRLNGNDIADDELKMEAWAIKLIREIKTMIQNMPRLSKAQVYEKLANVSIPNNETAKLFDLELDFVKEITSWIKNLPLKQLDNREKDNLTNNICELAEKAIEMDKKKFVDPNDKKTNTDFEEYVKNWISKLPLDKSQEIVLPVIIQQLINRMEKLKHSNISPKEIPSITIANKNNKSKKSKSFIGKVSKKNKNLSTRSLTDAIEKWSNALPINAENDDATENIKKEVCKKIFQEVGQLNMNPTVKNNDILYKDKLEDCINTILESLPQSDELEKVRDKLKDIIISTIVEIRNDMKDKIAGNSYKVALEKKIDSSIPSQAPCDQMVDPGFELYKDRLATAFILENFDHGEDDVKIQYEKLLKKEIDKYFNHANIRCAIPLSQEQLYNELYSALFKVPIPNEASVINEVEKVKTRREIDTWFEELPIIETNGLIELLERDKILSTLTSRIHEIEKFESKPDDKIFQEIIKWLVKLPLKPGTETRRQDFAMKLQKRLKSTTEQRKCALDKPKSKKTKDKAKAKTKVTITKSRENSQIAGPSGLDKLNATIYGTSQNRNPKKDLSDELYDIVHPWCSQLPLLNKYDQDNAQMLKDDLAVKLLIKVSDLNANTEIFDNNILYDKLLTEEIARILTNVPTICSFNKADKAYELKERIKSLKPRIIEERESHKYQKELIKTFDKFINRPQTHSPEQEDYLNGVRNDIIDDFIQYKYGTDSDEDKRRHKNNLEDNLSKYFLLNSKSNTSVTNDDPKNNLLMKANQLIIELAKISPKSNNILRDKIEEARMKQQISNFFDEVGVSNKNNANLNQIKENLAKKLNIIETNGYSADNENKMKQHIIKCLKKLGSDKNSAIVDAFLVKLKNNENTRRMPVDNIKDNTEFNKQECSYVCPSRNQNMKNYPYPSTSSACNVPQNFENIITNPPNTQQPRLLKNKTVEFKERSTINNKKTICMPQTNIRDNYELANHDCNHACPSRNQDVRTNYPYPTVPTVSNTLSNVMNKATFPSNIPSLRPLSNQNVQFRGYNSNNNDHVRQMLQDNVGENFELVNANCSHVCPSNNQGIRDDYSHPPIPALKNIAQNFVNNTKYPSTITPPGLIINQTAKDCRELQSCQENDGNRECITNQDNEIPLREEESSTESSSDDEVERICLCKSRYMSCRRRRPYCMMPIPNLRWMRYICEGRNLLNPLWCRMPLL